ncbi:hypothetical protein Tco_1024654 [Tanacetum coccineum]
MISGDDSTHDFEIMISGNVLTYDFVTSGNALTYDFEASGLGSCYACSDSLLLTPLCCDDIHQVTPRVSALTGCDIGKIISSKDEGFRVIGDAIQSGEEDCEIDQDTEVTLFDETQGRYSDNLMFDTGVLDNEEVFVGQDMVEKEVDMPEKDVSTADPVTTDNEEVFIGQDMAKKEVDMAKKDVSTADPVTIAGDVEEQAPASTPIVSSSQSSQIKYKGKGIMVEKPKKMQMKDQVLFDKQELNLMRKTGLQEKRKNVNVDLIAQ